MDGLWRHQSYNKRVSKGDNCVYVLLKLVRTEVLKTARERRVVCAAQVLGCEDYFADTFCHVFKTSGYFSHHRHFPRGKAPFPVSVFTCIDLVKAQISPYTHTHTETATCYAHKSDQFFHW